jgi:hypothetical protein
VTQAGSSAQREYEKRRARRAEEVRRRLATTISLTIVGGVAAGLAAERFYPGLGWLAGIVALLYLALQFWGARQHIESYGKGAEGERKTGRVLDDRKLAGYRVLHDRRIPGSRANIDHIAIGPGGVFVVETKSYKGKLEIRRDEIFVSGRNRTSVLEQTWREAVAVQGAVGELLADFGLDVVPLLCIHGVEFPWGKTAAQGVRIVGPRGLRKTLESAEPRLTGPQIQLLADRLDTGLKSA